MDRTKSTQPRTLYSDFPNSFAPHPDKKDLTVLSNDNAVRQSIRNLLLTDKFERLFQPSIGSNIRRQLFEPLSDQTAISLRTNIIETISNYEPRAVIQNVKVTPDYNRQSYDITIVFTTTTVTAPASLSITLQAVR